ncbi:MAG: hypothetical protein SPI77_00650 [Corynebacterium sp.]|nr:hypothetical protein [Corynebacterium sp.]
MSGIQAAVARFIGFIGFLVCTLTGLWIVGLYVDHPWAVTAADLIDSTFWSHLTTTRFYPWLAGLLGAAGIVLGAWLIVGMYSFTRVSRVNSAASGPEGNISLQLTQIADAVAQSFRSDARIAQATYTMRQYRGQPTMEIVLTADPTAANNRLLLGAIEQAVMDIEEAIGDAEINIRFLLHAGPVVRVDD